MSSKEEKLNKSLFISFERELISNLDLDTEFSSQNNPDIFISILNKFSLSNINLLYFLNKLLPIIPNFNGICTKYFTILIDSFKFYMNKNKLNTTNYELVLILNSISNFIKIFSSNQEKYNEKHKNILKQFPQFLQLFFKLFQQKFDEIFINYSNKKKVIESFFILCLTFVEHYPTLMRNYQNIIENFIKNIFYKYVVNNDIQISTVNISIVLYANLYKLSPNMIIRHQDYILIIINNIKYYMEYFRPKTIEKEENNKNKNLNNKDILEQKNNLFYLDKDKNKIEDIDNKNIVHADKIMEILFNSLNNIFNFMANNIYFEVDLNNIFPLFIDILSLYESLDNDNKSRSSLSMIVFNGLSKTNYELFLINTNEKIIDILIYLISTFSRYIYCYNIFFSKYINKILLNQKFFQNSINTFNLHIKILSFFSTIISFYNHILPEEIELIIYKHLYNNLPMIYLKYLEQKDKTLLKVDEIYFKASSVKNKIYSYDNNLNINENISPNENNILLSEYLKLLLNYCSIAKNINQLNYKNILGGIIDLIILPSYAKFIFNIDYDIKKNIVEIIEVCAKRNLIYINKAKLFHFLTNFYFFDGNLKYKAEIVINLLQMKDTELLKGISYDDNNNYYGGIPNNISEQILDFNKKIKEYLNGSYKRLQKINLIKDENKEDDIIMDNNNNEEDYHINNEMLNKKRKNKEDGNNSDNEKESDK